MKTLRLLDLANKAKGINENIDSALMVKGISTDSRKVKEGDLFIAIEGENFDGHDFVRQAFEKGCSGVVVHKDIKDIQGLPVIKVDNTLHALHEMARYYMSLFDIPRIAVTGSTGKTTTKEMIYKVLSQKYNVIKNIGNYNNHIGLPLSVFQIEEAHEIAVFEMGMSGFGEIDLLASIVRPDIAVITNVGLSHIENLGSQENILKAKLEVTNYFSENNTLIINRDDFFLNTVSERMGPYQVMGIGFNSASDGVISDVTNLGEKGVNFLLTFRNMSHGFKLNAIGEHNVYNASMAVVIGLLFDVHTDDIAKGISEFEGYNMRLNVEESKRGIKILNDAYNASPDSMKAAIDTLMTIEGQRHIAILSDMLEMGDYSEKYHLEVGKYAAESGVDQIISVGNNALFIAKGAVNMPVNNVCYYKANIDLINDLGVLIKPGDVVLVKGSRGMRMEEIVHSLKERG